MVRRAVRSARAARSFGSQMSTTGSRVERNTIGAVRWVVGITALGRGTAEAKHGGFVIGSLGMDDLIAGADCLIPAAPAHPADRTAPPPHHPGHRPE